MKKPIKILIAPDKFKGSLSAMEVCAAIAAGLNQKRENLQIKYHPMADGGDGSLEILATHFTLEAVEITAQDPFGRPIKTVYYTSDEAAFIEVASASGLVLLQEEERNPMLTSTLGTGTMVLHAIKNGYQNIFLFLGGSATNDAGMGIANALGFQFLDKRNNILSPIGMHLKHVTQIKNREIIDFSKVKITVFCDVVNPLHGANGAAHVYATQKGATHKQVRELDKGLVSFSKVLKKHSGLDIASYPGSGAAGGIGAGLVVLCGAKMEKGFEIMAKLTQLEENIQAADYVISGEGKLDEQSLQGKVVDGIARLCQKHDKPLSLLVGKNDLTNKSSTLLKARDIKAIIDLATDTHDAMTNGKQYLQLMANDIGLS